MLIGIDGNEANVERKVGVGEFAFELLKQFENVKYQIFPIKSGSRMETTIGTNVKYQIYLKNNPREELPREPESIKYRVFGPGKLWTQWRLPLDLYFSRPRPDVFFSPSHYAPRFTPVPTVVSVLDMSYVHFPELFKQSDLYQLNNWTEYSVKNAKAVVTISKSSRNDIIKLYGKPEKQVHVVYPGVKQVVDLEPHIYSMSELQSKYGISEKYILFVGTLQPRKNIERLIEAFSKVLSIKHKVSGINEQLQLIIVGKKGWLYESIITAPEKYGVKDRVKFLDYVPDEDLPLLYKNALCYVLPSLYEGFGLPILEAMQYDCPVITSNVSSMPEAGGDAALYVDPLSVDDIANKIEKVIGNEKLRKELIEKGRKQVKKFSWEKAARETLTILEDVATSK